MIRKDVVYLAIIVVLLVIVAVLTCQSPPEPVEDTRKYDSLLRVVQAGEVKAKELAEKRKAAEVETIQTKKSYDSLQKSSVAQIAYYRAHPKVIEIIREVPVIDSAFQAHDSAIVIRDNRIAELSGELYDCQKLASNAEENFKVTLQAQQGANAELVEDNQGLKKDLKKERRRGKLKAVLVPLVGVAALILGAQL